MPTSAAKKTTTSRSGNPATRAAATPKKVSSASDFKKKADAVEVELPSGNVARIRRIGVTSLLAEGLLGDELGALAQDAVDRAQPQRDLAGEAKEKMANDPKQVAIMLDAFDRITVRTWVEPKVAYFKGVLEDDCWRIPTDDDRPEGIKVIPEEDRDSGMLYSDELDIEDKIFTFQYVSGGDADLARFREKFQESLAGLSAGEGVAVSSQ